jgi:hypothetical protein
VGGRTRCARCMSSKCFQTDARVVSVAFEIPGAQETWRRRSRNQQWALGVKLTSAKVNTARLCEICDWSHYRMGMAPRRKYLIWDFDGTLGFRIGQWSGAMVQVLRRFAGLEVDLETLRPFLQKGFPWHNPHRQNPPMRAAEAWWDGCTPAHFRRGVRCVSTSSQSGESTGRQGTIRLYRCCRVEIVRGHKGRIKGTYRRRMEARDLVESRT